MSESKQLCSCGGDLPANSPFGRCPKCLLELGLNPGVPSSAEPAATPLLSQHSFGDYELLEPIGRGGMGIVYKARQKSLNRLVALKMIRQGESASPSALIRFHREAEAVASLEHPDIVSTYEIGEHEGQPFFSMRLIHGNNLAKEMPRLALTHRLSDKGKGTKSRLQRQEALERIARLVAIIAHAIHYAHQHGIIHRDLKPTNILIDAEGRPHLTDFGIAKTLAGQSSLTGSADVLGTPAYMAPEQAVGKPASVGADVYSLGAILYELLTGRPPFRADTPMETLRRVVEEEPIHPSVVNQETDQDLATICLKCIEKDPLRRYGSGEAVAEDLERWLRHEPIRARRAGPGLRMSRWVRRNRMGAGLIVTLALALATVATQFAAIYRAQSSREEAIKILRDETMTDLEELWENPKDPYLDIPSEKLAALRNEGRPRNPFPGHVIRLRFAVYTHQEPTKMLAIMSPVLARLEQSMTKGLSRTVLIDLRIYRRYDEAQNALLRGEVDFVRYGSASYVEAVTRDPRIGLLAAQNGRVSGYIFANTSAGVTNLPGLKGKSFACVETSSTTGNYLPKLSLFRAGLTSRDIRIGPTNYVGSHDSVAKLVASGTFDAGAANASVVDPFITNGAPLVVLKDFDEQCGLPWVARRGLDPAVARSIRDGLLAITDRAVLQALGNNTTGFVDAKDSDFDSLREEMKEARNFEAPEP
jgi:ABC-type phosphate/phosphonate transport system substrate-binding protein